MPQSQSQSYVPRVAVVGVHGVAHHDPGATANAMADLLLLLPPGQPDSPASYKTFSATGIRVPVRMPPVARLPKVERSGFTRIFGFLFGFLEEKSAYFARYGTSKKVKGDQVVPGQTGNDYMRLLLQDYKGGADGNFYSTTRLEGNRTGVGPAGPAEVHIYEMLWADLARPTNTILSFLFSLFQLVLHLGSLSRLAVDTGSSENSHWTWNTYCSVQRYAVRMLQMPIPLLKVILLVTLLACVPSLVLKPNEQSVPAVLMAGLVGLALTYLANAKSTRPVHNSPWTWTLRAVVPFAAGAGIATALLGAGFAADILLAIESWILVGSTLVLYVLGKYEGVRKGVKAVGLVFYAIATTAFAYYIYAAKAHPGVADPTKGMPSPFVPRGTLWTAIWIFAALRLSWILLFVLALLALGLGSLAWRSISKEEPAKRARARAAVRTSRFALALPAILFLLITTVLWAGMFSIARSIHDPFFSATDLSSTPNQSWLLRLSLAPDPAITRETTNKACDSTLNPGCSMPKLARIEPLPPEAHRECPSAKGQLAQIQQVPDDTEHFKPDYLREVLNWSVTDGFAVALILLGAVLFLLFWWVLPGVMTEKFPLRGSDEPPRASTNAQTERLGTWTSRGLDAISVITLLLWISIFVVAPLFLIEKAVSGNIVWPGWIKGAIDWSAHSSVFIIHSLAFLGGAAGLAAIIHYGSPVLSAILDVDTYLRTSPEDAAPRAKIAERYISLLSYLNQYRGADGRGYDSIVIVSHSLGTLISADLLRFLHHDEDLRSKVFANGPRPCGEPAPIKLLTMGSPIRQLLNRFFPFLYDWVRANPDNGLTCLPACSTQAPTINMDATPDPDDLGIAQWVNVYRSGDYVGRSLWLDEWYRRTHSNHGLCIASGGGRSEACIGAGAHTHYWDDTAPDVAEILNSLI
ncbi:MAG TPA: hypothetical protein VE377_02880 [Candidatus Dormibacteraeota bacterium]|nr:hypothetical protein [Candidatus Dormibacteraeota bacterium]